MFAAKALAERHCRATGTDRALYWLGFDAGRQAEAADENTARTLHRLVATTTAGAAGYLEGLAAARGVTA